MNWKYKLHTNTNYDTVMKMKQQITMKSLSYNPLNSSSCLTCFGFLYLSQYFLILLKLLGLFLSKIKCIGLVFHRWSVNRFIFRWEYQKDIFRWSVYQFIFRWKYCEKSCSLENCCQKSCWLGNCWEKSLQDIVENLCARCV